MAGSRRSSTESFCSAHSRQSANGAVTTRFPPQEEAALLAESQTQKASANALYAKSAFNEAIGQYDKALASCPNYLDYEVAVLKSNIAACHIKLAEWKEAVDAASKAIDGLERVMPSKKKPTVTRDGKTEGETTPSMTSPASANGIDTTPDPDAPVIELPDDDDEGAEALAALQLSDERRSQVRSLRAKSLMRRARANVELGGWAALAAAEQDYKEVLELQIVPKTDERFIRQQLTGLPLKINAAKEKEMAEMMGKLKELGNGILKPFGLSTDMFNFQQDPATGGYNMSFGGQSGQ